MGDTFQAKRTEVQTPDILRVHDILEGYIWLNIPEKTCFRENGGKRKGKATKLLLVSIVYFKRSVENGKKKKKL